MLRILNNSIQVVIVKFIPTIIDSSARLNIKEEKKIQCVFPFFRVDINEDGRITREEIQEVRTVLVVTSTHPHTHTTKTKTNCFSCKTIVLCHTLIQMWLCNFRLYIYIYIYKRKLLNIKLGFIFLKKT